MEPTILVRRFLHDTRAGATAIVAAALTVMTLGGAALITDHLWLVDQRDTLKSAADSASIAATIEMNRKLEADSAVSDEVLEEHLEGVAQRYIELSLSHLPAARLARAKTTLTVELTINRAESRVEVVAEADLGGTLVARALPLLGGYAGPEKMQATAAVECAGNAIEMVLAVDVTASMHGAIDKSLPATGDNRRLNAVVKAAKALVEKLRASCDGRSIAVGVVPWDKTVRIPSAETWRTKNWVELGHGRTGSVATDWAGCVEDRDHGTTTPDDAATSWPKTSLSLDLPATNPFPAFVYPDTKDFSVDPMAKLIRDAFPDLTAGVDDDLETKLKALRDNDWGQKWRQTVRGGNSRCTSTAMLPLTTGLGDVDTALDTIQASAVWGGGTLAHLGVTWGRRMLASSWRAVWGGDTHPIDPATSEVTKVLVLLTDGGNALDDSRNRLPGQLHAKHVDVPDCLDTEKDRPSACLQGEYASFYSAIGRLGGGTAATAAQGYYYSDWDVVRGTGGTKSAEEALSVLMEHSCGLARDEGVTVYTIGAMPSVHTRWRDALVRCSGAPGTADADRSGFYFEAKDGTALDDAFRAIARRVLTLRRVS